MSTQQHDSNKHDTASIVVQVVDAEGDRAVVEGALVGLYQVPDNVDTASYTDTDPAKLLHGMKLLHMAHTEAGQVRFDGLHPGVAYLVAYLNHPGLVTKRVVPHAGCTEQVCLEPRIGAAIERKVLGSDCNPVDCRDPRLGDSLMMTVHGDASAVAGPEGWRRSDLRSGTEFILTPRTASSFATKVSLLFSPLPGIAGMPSQRQARIELASRWDIHAPPPVSIAGKVGVSMTRTDTEETEDLPLWVAIRNGTEALSFNNYLRYIDVLFCRDGEGGKGGSRRFDGAVKAFGQIEHRRFLPFTDAESYRVLKAATEAFVMVNCAVLDPRHAFRAQRDNGYLDRRDLPAVDDLPDAFRKYLDHSDQKLDDMLPYLALVRRKLPDIPIADFSASDANLCVGFVQQKLTSPCMLELIWSYWHEEAMLVQTMGAVARRFQNVRSPMTPDPLANLEIDPLRPASNLFWGYIQDEQHRLTVNRRNYEYDHQYGLRLQGKAVQDFRPADTRSQFLESFHHLLRLCTVFYKQDDDTTVKADAFPLLNALKETHLVMSQGAHNQFGDLPSTARIEMLMEQWLLARPEFREFLPTRLMVAYPEPWMDRVDAMKKLQGWTDTSVVHFRNLAIFGEQLLLSIRYGAWSEVYEPTQAFNWARFWRPQVQGYLHGYWAATGVELGSNNSNASADATLPSLLLKKRLAAQQRSA